MPVTCRKGSDGKWHLHEVASGARASMDKKGGHDSKVACQKHASVVNANLEKKV